MSYAQGRAPVLPTSVVCSASERRDSQGAPPLEWGCRGRSLLLAWLGKRLPMCSCVIEGANIIH